MAVLVKGDEVRRKDETRTEAQIWDVNTPMLIATLTRPDIDLVAVEQGLDSRDGLFLHIAEMASVVDLVITTGGISVGEEDHVKPALLALWPVLVAVGLVGVGSAGGGLLAGLSVDSSCAVASHWQHWLVLPSGFGNGASECRLRLPTFLKGHNATQTCAGQQFAAKRVPDLCRDQVG